MFAFAKAGIKLDDFHSEPRGGSSTLEEGLVRTHLGHLVFHIAPEHAGFSKDLFAFLGWTAIYDAGGVLGAIVYEVKNTFGEQHAYVLPVRRLRGDGTVRQAADCAGVGAANAPVNQARVTGEKPGSAPEPPADALVDVAMPASLPRPTDSLRGDDSAPRS